MRTDKRNKMMKSSAEYAQQLTYFPCVTGKEKKYDEAFVLLPSKREIWKRNTKKRK